MYIVWVHSESEDHFGVSFLLHLYMDSERRAQVIMTVWQVLYRLNHLTVPTHSSDACKSDYNGYKYPL